jgi:uncharacterized protein
MDHHILKIAGELGISTRQVAATLELLEQGGTVPFIARYRKEMTGMLDEVQIAAIRDRSAQLQELDKRKESVLKTIEEQGKLTEALRKEIMEAATISAVEDLYLPFRPKKQTRASVAREKGLEPLALIIFAQNSMNLDEAAAQFEKDDLKAEAALAGARDIIAEWINEDKEARALVRRLFEENGLVTCKVIPGKEQEGQKYKDYFDCSEPVKSVPSHRMLAMRRGEKESILSLDIAPDEEEAIHALSAKFVLGQSPSSEQVAMAVKDCYKRLMKPSMETEIRLNTKKAADEVAIRVFAENLRQLLLASPLGQKNVLAFDPGFRTGCKVVCLDRQGKLLEHTVVYPNEPQKKVEEAARIIRALLDKHHIEAVAIGNGTASRETEAFVKSLKLSARVPVVMVNESGASVYSASQAARDEFPNEDLTVKGAVSIGRRLMDPLAELVKIDPKSIGVGQYQHDVDQEALKKSLDDTVLSCVNKVGVEVNTASKELLTYVSGIGPSLAKNIVEFRKENGAFKSREELKKVPRLGEKAFEQAAGFLRVYDAPHPLDSSAVHPESYYVVERMALDLNCTVKDLMDKPELRAQIKPQNYVTETVGLPTLHDILEELAKPGRDPREQFELFEFAEGVEKISDLKVGMRLPGIVTNITNFGVFVDIGVHQDGLVHMSQLANKFVKDPNEVVKVHQKVEVKVLEVDVDRRRISLTMKMDEQAAPKPKTEPREQKPKGQKPTKGPAGKGPVVKGQDPKKQGKPAPKPKEKELTFEEQLALLKSKFR